MAAFLSEEITGHGHLVPFGYILLQHGVVLHTSGNEVITTSNHFIPILELDVHGHVGADLLDGDIPAAALFHEEVASLGHLIPFGHILLQNAQILNALGQEVVPARDELAVNGHETDVHDHIRGSLRLPQLNQSTVANVHITQSGQLVALRNVGQSRRVQIVGAIFHHNSTMTDNALGLLVPIVNGNCPSILLCFRCSERRSRQQCQYHAQCQQH